MNWAYSHLTLLLLYWSERATEDEHGVEPALLQIMKGATQER